MFQQAFGHHRVAAGIELYGPDYIIAVEIRTLDDYGMYSALGFENQDYGNRNAHYNEIVEAARNWFDEVIFTRFPAWEIVEKTKGQICPFDGMPSYETLFQAFGGNNQNVAGRWSRSVSTGMGDEVLSHFIPSLTARQIKEAMTQIAPSPRREQYLAKEAQAAVEIVPFDGESSLMDALTFENSIHRNQLCHCHEMVAARRLQGCSGLLKIRQIAKLNKTEFGKFFTK